MDRLLNDERRLAAPALALCAACSFTATCLHTALDLDETEGVWGGTTPTERRLLADPLA